MTTVNEKNIFQYFRFLYSSTMFSLKGKKHLQSRRTEKRSRPTMIRWYRQNFRRSVGICLDIYPGNMPRLEPRNLGDKTICITPRNTGQISRNSDFPFSWHPPIFKNCNGRVKIQFVNTMHSLHSQSCQVKCHCSLTFLVDTQGIMKKLKVKS